VRPEFAKAMHWYRAAEASINTMTRTA
jgi:hypothetical protein